MAPAVEESLYGELAMSDVGSWMGQRFAGMHVARFDDALRLARALGVRLVLDIQTPGIGVQVLQTLTREGMLKRVEFNGEWADVKKLDPQAHDVSDHTAWVRFPITAAQVSEPHRKGKAVVANFSDSQQEMDLDAMKGAVAAGVDAINVDYPRLGADAVGRPVERTIAELIEQANHGDPSARCQAVLELARYCGFPLQDLFADWLEDPEPRVSRAAALALLQPEYRTKASLFVSTLHAQSANVRANAVWALGRLGSSDALSLVLPLLADRDPSVRAEVYLAGSRLPGEAPVSALFHGLADSSPPLRGDAALALAQHAGSEATAAIDSQLEQEMKAEPELYEAYIGRRPKSLSTDEIARVTAYFRCQMQMVKALARLSGEDAATALEHQAFRADADFSQMNEVVAAFALCDRIGADPRRAIEALGSSDPGVADRAERMLVHAGPETLPAVRRALQSSGASTQFRAMRIVSMAGDSASLPILGRCATGRWQSRRRRPSRESSSCEHSNHLALSDKGKKLTEALWREDELCLDH